MLRSYNDGTSDTVNFFFGYEIEKTPAYNMKTLFIVGLQPIEIINEILSNVTDIKHLFFGANHSFAPNIIDDLDQWNNMIEHFLNIGYLCTLDIPYKNAEELLDYGFCEYNNFIPQIRIPMPYISSWNYNTTIKFDDIGFNQTNPGVWVHRLHNLMNDEYFTSWQAYDNDVIIRQR